MTLALLSLVFLAAPEPSALRICVTAEGAAETVRVPGATVVLVATDGSAAALIAGSDGCAVAPLGAVPAGTYHVTVVAPGAAPRELDVVVTAEGGASFDVRLDVAEMSAGEEHVVEAKREQVGETRRVVDPRIARTVPGTQGDALKAVQNLPGLARTPFGAGGLLVRGAAPEDTKVFLDGQEIPQLYHFGGLTSVVATDMLSSIDFLPGGFGVRYGRATAGVVDVETRGARDDRWARTVDADVYDAELLAEGPIGDEPAVTGTGAGFGRVSMAARRSYIDAVLPMVVPQDALTFTVAPRYYDYQVRYDAPLAGGSSIYALVYGSDDAFTFLVKEPLDDAGQVRGKFLFATRFHRALVPFTTFVGDRWMVKVTPGAGYQDVVLDAAGLVTLEAQRSDLTLRAEARGDYGRVRILTGLDAAGYSSRYSVRYPDQVLKHADPDQGTLDTQRTREERDGYPSLFTGLFAQAEVDVAPGLTLIPGVRADHYLPQNALSADPRFAARFDRRDWFAKGYAGVYHQPPLFPEWDAKIGNPDLAPPVAYQLGAGGGADLFDGSTHVEGEVFWKWLDDLVVQRPPDPSNPSARTRFTNDRVGRAYGGELLVKRELSENVYGWIAYTLSRSERADPYQAGGWKPFAVDQTHILTTVFGWKVRDGWEVGARFRYATGNPQTPVTASIYDSDRDVFMPMPGDPGSARVPSFNQLDLRVDRRWKFETWSLTAYLDVQNVYVRRNPEGVRYDFDFDNHVYITGLPLIPSIGLRGEF